MSSRLCWSCGDPTDSAGACEWCNAVYENRRIVRASEEDVMDHDREARYRVLANALAGGTTSRWMPFYYVSPKKPHGRMDYWNGKTQIVRCIYCDTAVHTAKQATKGARARKGGRFPTPPELNRIQNQHSYECAENWWWSVMSRYSTDTLNDEITKQRIWAWVQRIHSHAAEYEGRYGHAPRQWHPSKTDVDIRERIKALPMPVTDPRFTELEVNWFHAVTTVFAPDRPHWKEFVHGADGEHPHVFLPCPKNDFIRTASSSSLNVATPAELGLCPCGHTGPVGLRWSKEDGLAAGKKIAAHLEARR